ncbi:glycosyltransferase family 9 protein [Vibrio methylphosphonaticus]|uniref:glycosyltransferase family 9 protein n=1 Tax=Vibrio methylphosphonaticus TaxID=2946866 RepID=UPI00202A7C5E|nr:glycosyltransferase family 9 protein [Vibrio methylphosphonaticus]MCL9777519.1 glycosyltransferase family 9 protein [Vibrio methylphosphonaticus]
MALFSTPPKSLCILRLSAIGDVCNTIAAVQAIQSQWPETSITWITGKLEAKLLESIDGIDVVVFDKKAGWQGYQKLWQQLKGKRFDALLHMQYAFRASIATLGIKATYKLGFDGERAQDFQGLFTNVKVPSPEKMHVLDGLMAFTETLGIPAIEPTWHLQYSDDDYAWAKAYIAKKRNLVIVPAASKGYKNWTAEGYVDVIEYATKLGWNIILAGSPAQIEVELGEKIEKRIASPIANLIGESSLLQMLALLDLADLVIAPDTGPTHMANAMKTPVIGLYAHHNPKRTGPYNYQDYVVSVYEDAILAETGKASSELSWRARVKDKKAMLRISSNDVIEMFNRVVKAEALD